MYYRIIKTIMEWYQFLVYFIHPFKNSRNKLDEPYCSLKEAEVREVALHQQQLLRRYKILHASNGYTQKPKWQIVVLHAIGHTSQFRLIRLHQVCTVPIFSKASFLIKKVNLLSVSCDLQVKEYRFDYHIYSKH